MRRKLLLCVLASIAAVALSRRLTRQTPTTDKSDDYEPINLDPDKEDTTNRSTSDESTSKVTECETDNNQLGICVPHYLCEVDSKKVIDDGNALIDLRKLSCPNILVCCLTSQVQTSVAQSSPPTSEKVTTAPITGKCGFSNPGANIISIREGGSASDNEYAEFGEFPWMIAVLKRSNGEEWISTNYIGGGSLIHPSVVMTVAHKMTRVKANEIQIRAGEYDTNSEEDEPYQERNVKKIDIHEFYFRASLYNDIALLFLEDPVNLNDAPHIGIGCLAPALPRPGTTCFSMGWGAGNFANTTLLSAKLKKVKLPLLGKEKCEEDLRKTHYGEYFELHQSLVCAGGEEGVDTCRGDGGSSLVCPINAKGSRFAIYGMVAFGPGCGGKDRPGVYVNIPDLYEWIGRKLANEGLDSNSYTYV